MPDHCHLLVQVGVADSLSSLIGRLKAHTARACNQLVGAHGPVWQRGFHDRALRREAEIPAAARYIVRNPVRAGLVSSVGQYSCWNAVWL